MITVLISSTRGANVSLNIASAEFGNRLTVEVVVTFHRVRTLRADYASIVSKRAAAGISPGTAQGIRIAIIGQV